MLSYFDGQNGFARVESTQRFRKRRLDRGGVRRDPAAHGARRGRVGESGGLTRQPRRGDGVVEVAERVLRAASVWR